MLPQDTNRRSNTLSRALLAYTHLHNTALAINRPSSSPSLHHREGSLLLRQFLRPLKQPTCPSGMMSQILARNHPLRAVVRLVCLQGWSRRLSLISSRVPSVRRHQWALLSLYPSKERHHPLHLEVRPKALRV